MSITNSLLGIAYVAGLSVAGTLIPPAKAGELIVEVSAAEPGVVPKIAIHGGNDWQVVESSPPGGPWSIQLVNPKRNWAQLEVSATTDSDDYGEFRMKFDAPYYWGADGSQTKIYIALVNDRPSSDGILEFLIATRAGPRDSAGFVEVNQRARRLWASQYKLIVTGRINPGSDEVRIAYWLLMTSQKLADERFMLLDDVSLDALSWMESVIADPELSARLLSGRTVPKADAEALVLALRSRDTIARSKIVQRLERERSRDRDATCARAESLDNFLTSNDFADVPTISTALRVKILLILCMADDLKRASPPLSDEQRESAQALLDDTDALIAGLADSRPNPDPRPQAMKRAAELVELITLKSNASTPGPGVSQRSIMTAGSDHPRPP